MEPGRSCNKRIYATQREATDAITGFSKDVRPQKANKKPSKSYYCSSCKGFHLYTEGKKHSPKKTKTKEFFTSNDNKQHNKGQRMLIIRNYNV